jgi:hypothetical protein
VLLAGIIIPAGGITWPVIGLPAMVAGIVVAGEPAAIVIPVPGVPVAHWPVGQALAVRDPQQLLHPTADRSTSPATPAACKMFFIVRSPVSCPPVSNPRRLRTFRAGPHGRGACAGYIGFSAGQRQPKPGQ